MVCYMLYCMLYYMLKYVVYLILYSVCSADFWVSLGNRHRDRRDAAERAQEDRQVAGGPRLRRARLPGRGGGTV